MEKLTFVVVPDVVFNSGERETLPPCGVFSTIELARQFVNDHYQNIELVEPWDEELRGESYTENRDTADEYHADIVIWGYVKRTT